MRVIVWGLGYVGSVTAGCLAHLGHEVVGVDVADAKVRMLRTGRSPVVEPGLDALLNEAHRAGRLTATLTGVDEVGAADISLICVGTPTAPNGAPVLDYVKAVAAEIGQGLRDSDRYHVVVLRSTVLPGTAAEQIGPIVERESGRRGGTDFGLAVNPEFLRETTAVDDFLEPPYTLIGELDGRSGDAVQALFERVDAPVYRIPLGEAETLKLASNAFHSLKIGFANEIGRLCDRVGVDPRAVMRLLAADTKLNSSPAYLRPGFGFGGSCLPKDLRALIYHARRHGVELPILQAVLPSNQLQIQLARAKVHALGIRRVGVLGLGFKPRTDDLRESPTVSLIRLLWQDGLDVIVYDPDIDLDRMVGSNRDYLQRQLPQIQEILAPDLDHLLDDAGAIVVSQDRPEFAGAVEALHGRLPVIDLVGVDAGPSGERALQYTGICW